MAQSVIGALRVNLGLDSAQFQKGAKRVAPHLRAMKAQFVAVAGVATAFGAALSAAALKGAQDIDRAAKSARRLDASIGGFRALELAAGEAGVSLSGLANDVQTMNRELATVGEGGKAGDALKKLGLTAADLAGLDADEKVARIADRVAELGLTAGEATAILRDLGVRNREMALLMIGGGDAIRQARAAVEDYGLALNATDAGAIEAANDKLARLAYIGQYAGQQLALALVPAFGELAQAMTDSLREGGLLRGVIDAIAANVVRVSTYIGTAAVAFGVRYVGALAAARIATLTFSGSLVALRGALIRTGIGALVVLGGELVYQFSRLVSSAGGFGEALSLLGDLAREVWRRMGLAMRSAGAAMAEVWHNIRAGSAEALAGMITAAVDFGNRYVGVWRGAFGAIKALWGALPGVIGDLAYGAANAMIGGVEAMLNAVVNRINNFIGTINSALSALSGWAVEIPALDRVDLGGIENPYTGAAKEAGAAAAEAFAEGFATDTFAAPENAGLKAAADEARAAADSAGIARDALRALATSPLTSLGALRDMMAGTAEETENAGLSAEELAAALDGAGDGGGAGGSGGGVSGAAKQAGDALEKTGDKAKSISESIKGAFKGAFSDVIKEAKTLAEGLSSILSKIGDMFLDAAGNLLFSGISKGLGSVLSGVPGFANGTDSAPGGLAWVGEQGRELVNLPRGAQVVPNHKIGRLGGKTQLEVIPSPYFDTRVSEVSQATAAPMLSGVARAGQRAHGGMSSMMYQRGTTT